MAVVATAGHVDHGKSALVLALTGTDPDRLPEERRRGLTIELGHAWVTLGDSRIALVDVPGHDRLVGTTIAGVGPAALVLLVVAADEGWSAQTEEHVAAVRALGVGSVALVVTKADLADGAPVLADAVARLEAHGVPPVATAVASARTGVGLDDVRAALEVLAASAPTPDPAAPVRFWVDRSFSVVGSGTVVTGTLPAGRVHVGDTLLVDGARRVVVRGVQVDHQSVDEATGPTRVALNLRGVPTSAVPRGSRLVGGGDTSSGRVVSAAEDVGAADPPIAAGTVGRTDAPRADAASVRAHTNAGPVRPGPAPGGATSRSQGGDARVTTAHVVDVELDPLVARWPSRAVLHVGTTTAPVRIRPLGPRFARITLDVGDGLPLVVGDRLLLRDPGAHLVLGGADVLALSPAPFTRRGDAARRAEHLADPHLLHGADVVPDRPTTTGARTHARHPSPPSTTATAGAPAPGSPSGSSAPAAARAAALQPAVAPASPESAARPPRASDRALEALTAWFAAHPFGAAPADLLADPSLTPAVLAEAERAGIVLRTGGAVLAGDVVGRAVSELGGLPAGFGPGDAARVLGTSRRAAVALLERLDALGHTRRAPDGTRRLRLRP